MENASKFLLMAASLILGLMLIAVFIYVFRAGAKTNESYEHNQASLMLEAYNSKFEVFDKENNTILDLVTVFNLAYDVNTLVDYDSQSAIGIKAILNSSATPITLEVSNTERLVERNTIWFKDNQTSIYDILNKRINSGNPSDTNSLNITGIIKPDVIADLDGDNDVEEFSWPIETKIENTDTFLTTKYNSQKNKTIYKYIFRANPEKTRYDGINGKITYMEFEACFNYEYYL